MTSQTCYKMFQWFNLFEISKLVQIKLSPYATLLAPSQALPILDDNILQISDRLPELELSGFVPD